jgi:hypothetical protein
LPVRILGLRVRSGFAVGVLVQGTAAAWRVERRMDLPLTMGQGEYARFPFHPLIDMDAAAGAAASEQALADVRSADKALDPILRTLMPLDLAVIVAGSLLAPEKIANPHMRTHSKEGQLFRTVLSEALQRNGVAHALTGEKQVRAQAAEALALSEADLSRAVTAAGRGTKPWRTDEKLATFGALWKLTQAAPIGKW